MEEKWRVRERDGRAVAAIIAAFRRLPSFGCGCGCGASVVMQRLSYPTETVLSKKIARNIIVPSFKVSPRKPLRRRPVDVDVAAAASIHPSTRGTNWPRRTDGRTGGRLSLTRKRRRSGEELDHHRPAVAVAFSNFTRVRQ